MNIIPMEALAQSRSGHAERRAGAPEAARPFGLFDQCRAELPSAEKSAHLVLHKKLYEDENPETKSTKDGGPGRGKTRSQNEIVSKPAADAIIDDTAKNTGASRATIGREIRHCANHAHKPSQTAERLRAVMLAESRFRPSSIVRRTVFRAANDGHGVPDLVGR